MAGYRRWQVIAVCIVSCFLALFVIVDRTVDEASGAIELAVDYEAAMRLSGQVGYDLDLFLVQVRERGATSLLVRGMTVNRLQAQGDAVLLSGQEMSDAIRLGEYEVDIDADVNKSYLIIHDQDTAKDVAEGLDLILGHIGVDKVSFANGWLISVAAGRDELDNLQLPVGGCEQVAKEYGFNCIFVVGPVPWRVPEASLVLIDRILPADGGRVLFYGWTVPGYPQYGDDVGVELKARGISIGTYENRYQQGIETVITHADYTAFRARLIAPGDRPGSIALAAKDRNISLFCVEPTLGMRSVQTAVDEWLNLIERARNELEGANFVLRPVTDTSVYRIPVWILFLVGCGVGGGLWLCLQMIHRLRYEYLGILVCLLTGAIAGSGHLGREAIALLAAASFPSLGVLVAMRFDRNWRGVLSAVVTGVAIAMVGGVLVAGLLGDTAWTLQIRQFRGVKIAHMLPVLIVGYAGVVSYVRQSNNPTQLVQRSLGTGLTVGMLMLSGIAVLFAYVYVGRTGHTLGLPVPDIEVWLRGILEQSLGIRPRTKEWLIGYPALMLAIIWCKRQSIWAWGFALIGATALASVVNSFSHLHTPVLHSAIRSVLGAGLGLAVGACVVSVYLFASATWGGRANARFTE